RFAHHPAVEMARSLTEKNGVAFDAVMSMAISLSPPPTLTPLVPFGHGLPDERWGPDGGVAFLPLLRAFYNESDFGPFFAAHQSLYLATERSFHDTLSHVDFGWYERFYRPLRKTQFKFILGLNNGPGFYGPHVNLPDGKTTAYAIIGCKLHDDAGTPIFKASSLLPLVLHEFNHSFVNPAVDAQWSIFHQTETVYNAVSSEMQKQAYGDAKTMVDESIVRAAVLVYLSDTKAPQATIDRLTRQEQLWGFFWMPELTTSLKLYEKTRTPSDTFASWVPRIAETYLKLAPDVQQSKAAYSHGVARVTGMKPFSSGAQEVDSDTKVLTLFADRPLRGVEGDATSPVTGMLYPVSSPGHLSNATTIELPLHLLPHTHYGFRFAGAAFFTADGYPLEEQTIDFMTR
ncbi:MAG: DUF4932 domain-containing protein, partial [Candidatus Eremiobacteraeota bacterium]|nr:DUF4932 domain-containing protein [Candidatus Eremiobacteraeota bacterium]